MTYQPIPQTPQKTSAQAPAQPARFYSGWVDYGNCSAAGFGGATLEEAKKDMVEKIAYYSDLGYPITDVKLELHCSTCNGSGEVPKKGRVYGRMMKCPDCKGKESSIKIL